MVYSVQWNVQYPSYSVQCTYSWSSISFPYKNQRGYESWSLKCEAFLYPPCFGAPYLPATRRREKPYKKCVRMSPNHWNGSLAAVTHTSYVRKSRCLQVVRTQLLSVRLNFYKIPRGHDQTSHHIGDNINHNNHQSSVFIDKYGYTICITNGRWKPFQVCTILSSRWHGIDAKA